MLLPCVKTRTHSHVLFEFTWFSSLRLQCPCMSMLHICQSFKFHFWSRNSVVGVLTRQLDWTVRGSNPGSAVHLDIYSMCVGVLSGGKGLRRPAREVDYLPPTSAEVTNEWSYTAALPVCRKVKFYLYIFIHLFLTLKGKCRPEYSVLPKYSLHLHTHKTIRASR